MSKYLKIPLETNIPILTKDEDKIFRCSQIVAHWKRNIYRMVLNTYLENKDKKEGKIFEKVFELLDSTINGQYSISIDLKEVKRIELKKKCKEQLDFRLTKNIFYYKFDLYLFLQKNLKININNFEEKSKDIVKNLEKFYTYSFIYTILTSGLGQISSKGMGHLQLLEPIYIFNKSIEIRNSNDLLIIINHLYTECCKIILEIIKRDNYKIPDIFICSFKNEKHKYKPNPEIKKMCIEIVGETPRKYFYEKYINAMLYSKLKNTWLQVKSNKKVKQNYTWILGLPRISKVRRNKVNDIKFRYICSLKMLSQIKYIPYGTNCSDFDLLLLYYPQSIEIINTLYKYTNCISSEERNYVLSTFNLVKEFIFLCFRTYFDRV